MSLKSSIPVDYIYQLFACSSLLTSLTKLSKTVFFNSLPLHRITLTYSEFQTPAVCLIHLSCWVCKLVRLIEIDQQKAHLPEFTYFI